MLLLLWGAVIFGAIYLYFKRKYSIFQRYGVNDDIYRYYFGFPEERFVGKYEFLNPVVIIRDLELVKRITVKDFEYFLDHRTFMDEENDPLFGRNLFSMKGQTWKDMRSTLSPAFTSSKMKHMVPFMAEVGDQMNKAIKKNIAESREGYIDVDIKDLTSRFANDVVASCAFGLKVDSHQETDNQFYARGKEASEGTFRQLLVFFGHTSFPKLMKALRITLISQPCQDFFRKLVNSTMENREERNIFRPDMIHLLMEAKKGQLTHEDKELKDDDAGFATVEESSVGKKGISRVWSNDDLVAQAVLFFVAGFETVSSTMSFLLHELALNPEIQERLVQEIRENEAKNGGNFDYNSIQSLTYLDMVVSELLRLWPAGTALDRVCIKDYNVGRPNDKSTQDFIIRKGTGISIPVWGIHHDPRFYPDPFKFNPERFSEENKHKIKPFTYMPFGVGPRNCIGSRFALCEMKVMVYQLLSQVEMSPCEKTCIPTQLSTDTFQLKIKGGHWLRLKSRA